MSKLRVEISGCMRSMTGAEEFCAIRSCLAAATRHGLGALEVIVLAVQGNPWTRPGAPAATARGKVAAGRPAGLCGPPSGWGNVRIMPCRCLGAGRPGNLAWHGRAARPPFWCGP
jgi:hypothetical protein